MSTYEANRYAFPATAITAGTFDNARLSSGSVTQHVDLTALSASNLTSGTIPDARYGTPTFSGANITNLSTATVTGTWTPTFSSGSFTNITGHYQKVGKFVYCTYECQCTANPSGTSVMTMGGLPFTAISISSGHTSWIFIGTGYIMSAGSFASGGSGGDVYVKDNTTSWGIHQKQGWRNSQYFLTPGGYGGIRANETGNLMRNNADERWMSGRIFYVANS